MNEHSRLGRMRWLFMLFAALALVWTIWLLWDSWPLLRANLPLLRVRWLLLTLAGNLVGGYLGFEAFRVLFLCVCASNYKRRHLAHLYFTGQLMKHLPGRVWGIAYQSVAGHRASLAQWVGVTVTYMVLTTGFALWAAAVVLGFMGGAAWGIFALFAGLVLYVASWHPRPLQALLAMLHRIPGRASVRLSEALKALVEIGSHAKLQVLFLFASSWLVYLLSWAGYGLAWPGLSASQGIQMCAMYTLAWFVGYVSVISPSGAGVRELVFVLLAHRFPPDAVVGMAVLGRITLLIVDVIFGILFAPFRGR